MELKEKLLSSFIAFENQNSIDNSFINELRGEAIKIFENEGFPTKKNEAWKYTSLNKILKEDYSIFPKAENTIEYKDIQQYFIHDIDSYKIIFIDGKYASHLSKTTHEGIDVSNETCTEKGFQTENIIHLFSKKILKKDFRNDISNLNYLKKCIKKSKAEIIFHLAAQSSVVESFKNSNHNLKIYNASTDGKSVSGYINDFNFWFPKIPNFNPEYVIFYIGINDKFDNFDGRYFLDNKVSEEKFDQFKDYIKNNSFFVDKFKSIKNKYFPKNTFAYDLSNN